MVSTLFRSRKGLLELRGPVVINALPRKDPCKKSCGNFVHKTWKLSKLSLCHSSNSLDLTHTETLFSYFNMSTDVCASCYDPLVIEIDPDSDSETQAAGSSSTPESIPDDVELGCGCHYHW